MTGRETWIHIHMARAGQQAARDWDRMTPGEYHAAALLDLCIDRKLSPSSGCGMRIADFPDLPLQVVESEGGEVD